MLTGNLKLLVLKLVSIREMSGYNLMKSIKERTGSKPSPGSIYPILEDMKKQDLITVREAGRSKLYSITDLGKTHISELAKQNQELMDRIKTAVGVFCTLTGQTEEECIKTLHQEYLKEKEDAKQKEKEKQKGI